MEGIPLGRTSPRPAPTEAETEPGREANDAGTSRPRPALFAGYADLAKLRYDYPLVLLKGEAGGAFVRSLSALIDDILREIAPQGIGGERLRKHLLRLEGEMRSLVARGARASLSRLWEMAETGLLATSGEAARGALRDSLNRARAARRAEGEVIDCDADTPARLLAHAFEAVYAAKAGAFRERAETLVLKLSDILKADFMKSDEARNPSALRSFVGSAHAAAFDFEAMSRILTRKAGVSALPEERRSRIRAALAALEAQRFYPLGRTEPYKFVFESCAEALEAFRARLPEMVEVVKAISVAELEIENRYRAAVHDPFFARFGPSALGRDELALFPPYLVCLRDGQCDPAETTRVAAILASDLPLKVLVQSDDILGDPSLSPGPPSGGGRAQLAAMALGLGGAYVLQAPSSGLYRVRERLRKGLDVDGPAIFSVYSGATRSAAAVPPYLLAAAASESRAFPTFAYDPAAGPDWASRFSIADNPQPELGWPIHRFAYEDADHQRVVEDVAFTFADFAACDVRYAGELAEVTRAEGRESMVTAGEYLALAAADASGKTPYVLTIDDNGVLHRVAVGDKLTRAARRCAGAWRSLQELGGIDNSHATRLLERERKVWTEAKEKELAALRSRPEPAAEKAPPAERPSAAEPALAAPESEAAETAPSDEPYIETARCTSCNECTDINNKMFAYDENKQAYIADLNAGTYRELVEAAEACQVSIIHPGKPKNLDEPNLDELIARAEPFN